MLNSLNLIKAFLGKGGNPEQFVSNALKNNSNPMLQNLANMAKNGNNQSVESFARNLFKEQNRNFDKEFKEFMEQVNGK